MRGLYLFNNFEVELDPRSIVGWLRKDTGKTRRVWDSELMKFFYGKISQMKTPTFLDIGAGDGSFSMLAKFHPMRVYAFEPVPSTGKILLENLRLNDLWEEVIVIHIALSDKNGWGSLYIPLRKGQRFPNRASLGKGLENIFSEWEEVSIIPVRTLDSLNLESDIIKIDVEGAELFVLRGGEQTIRRHMPPILMEYDERSAKRFGETREASVELLRSWGYKNFELAGSRSDLWITGG